MRTFAHQRISELHGRSTCAPLASESGLNAALNQCGTKTEESQNSFFTLISLSFLYSHEMNTTQDDALSLYYGIINYYDFTLSMASCLINLILGLPLNVYVLILILSRGTLVSDFFSFNLAISEIIYCFFIVCYMLFIILKSFACFQAFIFSAGFIYVARPFFQCFICIDCYIRVIHPVLFLKYKHLRYKALCCGVVWSVTLSSCVYSIHTFAEPLYLYGYYILNLLFFFVMLSCCLSILRALKLPRPGEMATKRSKNSAIKRRAFKSILIIIVNVVVDSVLYMSAIPMQCCFEKSTFVKVFSICMCGALLSGFVQPLLYLHRNGNLTCFLFLNKLTQRIRERTRLKNASHLELMNS